MTKEKMKSEAHNIINAVTVQGATLYSMELQKKITKKGKKLLSGYLKTIQESAYKILSEK